MRRGKLRRLVATEICAKEIKEKEKKKRENGPNVANDASETKQPRYWPAIINERRMTRDISNTTAPVCNAPYRTTLSTVRLAPLALHTN